jgi:predicted  nucleic acid-binding Zn-ribbon protein
VRGRHGPLPRRLSPAGPGYSARSSTRTPRPGHWSPPRPPGTRRTPAARRPARPETGPWRERALNAESELKRAHAEIATQRGRIGELPGRIRDLEHDLPEDGIHRTITENHALRAQVRQLTQDSRRLEERLAGARDINRFLDKRIADLEAGLLAATSRGQQEAP